MKWKSWIQEPDQRTDAGKRGFRQVYTDEGSSIPDISKSALPELPAAETGVKVTPIYNGPGTDNSKMYADAYGLKNDSNWTRRPLLATICRQTMMLLVKKWMP